MRISDWCSDVCSSDLCGCRTAAAASHTAAGCGARARRRRRRGCRAAGPAAGRSPGGGDPGVGILAARYSFDYSRIMETEQAIAALTALGHATRLAAFRLLRSEEHTSELQSLMRISYAVFCLKKKKQLKH